jgi:hypothetical protein
MGDDDLEAALTLFWSSPHFEGKRQLGMLAANLSDLVAWGAAHPGIPFRQAPQAGFVSRPVPVSREWTCTHVPHCGTYWAHERRLEVEAAKREGG